MQRRCEPELMDDPLQAQDYAAADFQASDAAFVSAVLRRCPVGDRPLRVLDLGCGPGNISFRLARACPQALVLGIDGAEAMLAIAEERLRAEPELAGRLRFQLARLPLPAAAAAGLSAGDGFDLIVSNSLLHHLPDPAALWGGLRDLAAPGAWLAVRDLRRPPDPASLTELVERHAGGLPPRVRWDFEQSLWAAFQLEEVRDQLEGARLAELRLEALDDRYLDVWGPIGSRSITR